MCTFAAVTSPRAVEISMYLAGVMAAWPAKITFCGKHLTYYLVKYVNDIDIFNEICQ